MRNYDEVAYSEDWYFAAVVGAYTILENQNFIPFGTTYDYYITQEQYEAQNEKNRGNLLLRALVLSEEQAETYGDLLQPLPEASLNVISYAAYLDDCADRAATAASRFVTDDDGFTAVITTQSPELVFFAVPYNDGWQATVNGTPAVVEKVDSGLCAVRVDAGESTIRFDYRAVGQKAGVVITLTCAALWAVYAVLLLILRIKLGRAAVPAPVLTEEEALAALEPWVLPEEETSIPADADTEQPVIDEACTICDGQIEPDSSPDNRSDSTLTDESSASAETHTETGNPIADE